MESRACYLTRFTVTCFLETARISTVESVLCDKEWKMVNFKVRTPS